MTLAFVTACGGNQQDWENRWRAVTSDVTAVEQVRPVSRASATFARPAQLPIGSMTFVGRAQALADAARVIGQAERVNVPLVIGGPIGAGKTSFALRLADEVAEAFPDGQLYADLGAATQLGAGPGPHRTEHAAAGIAHGFLRALGVPASIIPDDPMQRLGLYRSMLSRRRVFVLLDDVQDEAQVRPLLGRALQSLVVVTSRARLLGLDSMHHITLGTFTRDESLALLAEVIGAARIEAEYEAADVLAALCGDLPLAVNVIGRLIAARPEWAVAHAAGLLADEERLLSYLTVGDVSVREHFDTAYRRLAPAARMALGHLGARHSRWTTPLGLAGETGLSADAADRALESLVNTGLLTRATLAGRYCVSAIVSAYAASLHRDSDSSDLARAS